MKRVLVTGGSGFIGTNIIEEFNNNYEVLNIDINPPRNKNHFRFWNKCDIRHYNDYKRIVDKFLPEIYIHLAARTDLNEKKNINGYSANIEGVKNTIEIIEACPSIEKVIFASSRMVCRIDYTPKDFEDYCPPNLYGESKVKGEMLVKQSKMSKHWTIIRPTSIWGPWFDVPYKTFFNSIKNKRYFYIKEHNPIKSFGYVGNSIYQINRLLNASEELTRNKIFYLCDYPPISVNAWAEMIRDSFEIKKIPTVSLSNLKYVARIGDILSKVGWHNIPLTTFRLNNLITNMVYDTEELRNICGSLPYTLDYGVKETVKWIKSQEIKN